MREKREKRVISLFAYWLILLYGFPFMIKGLLTLEVTVAKLFTLKSILAYLPFLSFVMHSF